MAFTTGSSQAALLSLQVGPSGLDSSNFSDFKDILVMIPNKGKTKRMVKPFKGLKKLGCFRKKTALLGC